MPLHIIILGAGPAGLVSALALHKHSPFPKPKITVVEIRTAPSTIGGAVGLTPKALRYLDYLGVYGNLLSKEVGAECKVIQLFDMYSGKQFSEVDFRGPEGRGVGKERDKEFFSRRVSRWQLQEALLEVVQKQDDTEIVWGKKVTQIRELEGVQLTFADGSTMHGDMLVGCDGIHSAARSLIVDPDRNPTYTGVAIVMSYSKLRPETKLRWDVTGLASSRRGSLMCSYFEKTRTQQYTAAVIEMAAVADREGWNVRGSDQEAIKADLLDRFKSDSMPELEELIESAGERTLYPSYTLPPGGKWTSPGGRCILLGDAAHAMPPQGESTGICIEDSIIFSRAMMHHDNKSLRSIFEAYEAFRRPVIDAAYKQASQRWESVKDSGWFVYQLKTLLTPWLLWWMAKAKQDEWAEDYSDLDLDVQDPGAIVAD